MTWLGAALAGLAAWLAVSGRAGPLRVAAAPSAARPERSRLLRLRPLLAAVAVGGGWVMVGGPAGPVAGLLAGVTVWVVLGRTEDPAVVRKREQLTAELPLGVDLLASCLDVGGAPESALLAVAEALGGPVGEEFRAIQHRLAMGVDPADVWRAVAQRPGLGPLGRSLGRAHQTGGPVGAAAHQLAEELRARVSAEVEDRARSVEVKAAAPLGLCLLPAFMLLGVVPMVVGVFTSMALFR